MSDGLSDTRIKLKTKGRENTDCPCVRNKVEPVVCEIAQSTLSKSLTSARPLNQ